MPLHVTENNNELVKDMVGLTPGQSAAPMSLVQPIETPTNLDKLSLTGVQPGQEVLITEEANRLEKYIGGDIDDDANWAVLRNTVELWVAVAELFDPVVINGVDITQDKTWVYVGWVDVTQVPFVSGSGFITVPFDSWGGYFNNPASQPVASNIPTSASIGFSVNGDSGYFALPFNALPRSVVYLPTVTG